MSIKGVALLRQLNEKRTLAFLRQNRISSRQEIAKALGVSKNTASLVVESLIQDGFVQEVGVNNAKSAGRPSIRISVVPEALRSIGILIQEHNLQYVVTDYYSTLLEQGEIAVEAKNATACMEALISLCETLLERHPEVVGIGVGAPGLIDPTYGIVRYASRFIWQDVHLGEALGSRVSVPVKVLNQTRAAALVPMALNMASNNDIVFFIRVSEGMGGALIINRAIYHGAHSSAGEVGHVPILSDGPLCRCGKTGCLEPVLAIPGMRNALTEAISPIVPSDNFAELLHQAEGHPLGQELLRRRGADLGQLMAVLITILNPQMIIIDSPYADTDSFTSAALTRAEQCSLSYPFQRTMIRFMQLSQGAAIGAAASVFLDYEVPAGLT